MFINKNTWLGQIPLVLGPSSWGAGMMPSAAPVPMITPPYYGQWGVNEGGSIGAHGQVGPITRPKKRSRPRPRLRWMLGRQNFQEMDLRRLWILLAGRPAR